MIHFFRNIRQGSLAKNKVGKYLLYAAGEILLVVIGILLALQIDTWSEEHQQRKLEVKYLREIQNSLIGDLGDIKFNINFNREKIASNEVILKFLNREIGYSDSLTFHFANLTGATRTIINTSAYETVKSRGLEIISNDTLRQTITKLYSFTIYNLIDFETQDDHKFQYESFVPEIMKEINTTEIWKHAVPINQQRLLNNTQFKNTLTMNIFYRKYMLNDYQELHEKVLAAIDQLGGELKRLE